MTGILHSAGIHTEEDVVSVRRKAREIAALLGFDANEQTRIATAVSEVARDAAASASENAADFTADPEGRHFAIRIRCKGRRLEDLQAIMRGDSPASLALAGAQRLMDEFRAEADGENTTVVSLIKRLPARAQLTPYRIRQLAAEIGKASPRDMLEELRQQNRELLRLMDETRARQEDLARLNAELEHTNRGVVALYGEIDEKAERLRRADEMKSRFLSHMSHEFRTPLTSIMALSRLLTDEVDGKLTAEQHKQAMFIRKSAESLLDMVNELLEMARLEAGKSVVRRGKFTVSELFAALQGVLKPLRGVLRPGGTQDVELTFEEKPGIPELETDETKVAQILRNFISNALKFTERGRILVCAEPGAGGKTVVFSVCDTGIGIPESQLEAIFQEYAQVETPVQRRVAGTGLGLPLAKGLAGLLGGSVRVVSKVGEGSTFYAEIPVRYAAEAAKPSAPVLIIDDEEVARYLVRQALGPGVSIEADNGAAGIELARTAAPRAIILDLNMPQMNGYDVMRELKKHPETCDIPIVVLTGQALTPEEVSTLNGSVTTVLWKEILSQPDGAERLRAALTGESVA